MAFSWWKGMLFFFKCDPNVWRYIRYCSFSPLEGNRCGLQVVNFKTFPLWVYWVADTPGLFRERFAGETHFPLLLVLRCAMWTLVYSTFMKRCLKLSGLRLSNAKHSFKRTPANAAPIFLIAFSFSSYHTNLKPLSRLTCLWLLRSRVFSVSDWPTPYGGFFTCSCCTYPNKASRMVAVTRAVNIL